MLCSQNNAPLTLNVNLKHSCTRPSFWPEVCYHASNSSNTDQFEVVIMMKYTSAANETHTVYREYISNDEVKENIKIVF